MSRIGSNLRFLSFFLAALIATLVYSQNPLGTVPPDFFSTSRDGSEALVLGKIIADRQGVDTHKANLGFYYVGEHGNPSDALRVYQLVRSHSNISPTDLTDANWKHGYSRSTPSFILHLSNAEPILGYHESHFPIGATLKDPEGVERRIESVEIAEPFLRVHTSGPNYSPERGTDLELQLPVQQEQSFETYYSQYGLMGDFYSALYRAGVNNVTALQFVPCLLLALVIVYLSYGFGRIFGISLGVCFYVSAVFAPWLAAMARNLYWSPFVWLLPVAISFMWFLHPGKRPLYLLLMFFAFLIKSLSGYEYLSSIVILACTVHLAAPFYARYSLTWNEALKRSLSIFFCSVLAFVVAAVAHSTTRAGSIQDGLAMIVHDAIRRTIAKPTAPGRASDFSVLEILKQYILYWDIPVFSGLSSSAFSAILFSSLMISLLNALFQKGLWKRDLMLWACFLACPLSWLVLAKSHSFVHTHLNYVLWYFGLVPFALYILLASLLMALQEIKVRLPGNALKTYKGKI